MGRWASAVLFALVSLAGCGQATREGPRDGLTAAVSVLPHAWLVQQIGGQRVEVITLVRPGESAELYQPTDAQISEVARANVYFRTGMPLEKGRGLEALRSLGSLKVVDLRDGIALRDMAAHSHHEESGHDEPDHRADHAEEPGSKDPHIWLSPRLLKIQARTVAETLAQIDPDHKEEYLRNLTALDKQLDEADAAIGKELAPYRGQAFFVFHPAWGYFADEYGLRQIAIETEGKEPSDREVTELQNLARGEKVKVIFVHPQSGRRSADAIARAIHGRVQVIDDLPGDLLEGLLATTKLLAESFRQP